MQLSNDALEAMGLQKLPEGRTLSAIFHSLHVFEVRGFNVDTPALAVITGMIAGETYSLAIGSSLNAISRQLVQDDFAPSEDEWQKEHKCTPPYLLVHLGPTIEYESVVSHAKEDGQVITTYDSFPKARASLKLIADKVLPSLMTALACSFSSHNHAVRFMPTDKTVFGITPDKQTILDFRFQMSMSAYASSTLKAPQIEERLAAGVSIAKEINPKIARFYHFALDEDDALKKFLFYFLAIERKTHATFKEIDHVKISASLRYQVA